MYFGTVESACTRTMHYNPQRLGFAQLSMTCFIPPPSRIFTKFPLYICIDGSHPCIRHIPLLFLWRSTVGMESDAASCWSSRCGTRLRISQRPFGSHGIGRANGTRPFEFDVGWNTLARFSPSHPEDSSFSLALNDTCMLGRSFMSRDAGSHWIDFAPRVLELLLCHLYFICDILRFLFSHVIHIRGEMSKPHASLGGNSIRVVCFVH